MLPRTLLAALVCMPLSASAQYIPYKSITCTYEHPDEKHGEIFTVRFSEAGYVSFLCREHLASVRRREIRFCIPLFPPEQCYMISRTSTGLVGLENMTEQELLALETEFAAIKARQARRPSKQKN